MGMAQSKIRRAPGSGTESHRTSALGQRTRWLMGSRLLGILAVGRVLQRLEHLVQVGRVLEGLPALPRLLLGGDREPIGWVLGRQEARKERDGLHLIPPKRAWG